MKFHMAHDSKIWTKSVDNSPDSPCLDWIEKGLKIMEGRIYRDDWTKIAVGDVIIFTHGKKSIKTVVTNLTKMSNFGEAFERFGKDLIPIDGMTSEGAELFYKKYFPRKEDEEDIKNNGVIILSIKVA